MSEAQKIRFRVKVKRPEETREYLVVIDLQTLQDEEILRFDCPKLLPKAVLLHRSGFQPNIQTI
jgi:hypothetical protein